MSPDPRVTPARPDIAARFLESEVDAERYLDGAAMRCTVPVTPVFNSSAAGHQQVSQLLYGESFIVYENEDDWAWGQCGTDAYVGYVGSESLSAASGTPTHRITALSSHIYPEADLKTLPQAEIGFGSLLELTDQAAENRFKALKAGGWIFGSHVREKDDRETNDLAAIAGRFLNVPYLWGGRSHHGLDCSALIQLVLAAKGLTIPRDSDQQEEALSRFALAKPDILGLARDDIVFFPGHVGFMADDWRILHANAHHMAVTIDPLEEVVARVEQQTGGGPAVTSVCRPVF